MSVPEFASQGRNNGLKSRLNMRLVTENALRSHSQPRLGAIVSWALKKIREVYSLACGGRMLIKSCNSLIIYEEKTK